MKKHYLLLATAAMIMAGCANDDFIGEDSTAQDGKQAIEFNMSTPAMTRADLDGKTAAETLGCQFIVWGEKNEKDAATNETGGDLVFKNYRVQYYGGSANTTTSNTKDWEYVGITPYQASNTEYVSPSIYVDTNTKQTIKYWDFNTPYTFTAVSAKKSDITSGLVKITKNSDKTTKLEKGYTIQLANGATPDSIFVSDRIEVTKTTKAATPAEDAVTLTFRNFQSKIRFGIYETVPGYKAVITGIKYTGAEHKTGESDLTFGVDGNFLSAADGITYTVTYASDGKAKVEASGTGNTGNSLNTAGTNWLNTKWTSTTSTNDCIGEKATEATYDKTVGSDKKAYTAIMPNPKNTTDLTLQVKFDLYSEDTGEKIEGDYKTVKVPAEYCQWKSNYAYTYLFKITDKSADLYPITFDAVVAQDEFTGEQETITSVSEPSITTFAVKDSKYVSNENEYANGDVIYATVLDNGSIPELTADNINLYTVVAGTDNTTGAVAPTISEGSVANCLANTKSTSSPFSITDANHGTLTVTDATSELVNTVPAEDGGTISLDDSKKKALKWTAGTSGTTYAIRYKTSAGTFIYKIVKIQ